MHANPLHETDEQPDSQTLITVDKDGSLRIPESVLQKTRDDTFSIVYGEGVIILQGVKI